MTEYWDKEIETMPVNKIKALQLKLFNQQLERANKAPAYQGKLPQKIDSLDEVKNLSFTCKDDLRQNFPYGFLAVPREKIVRFNASSGTTGIPTLAYFTEKDIENIKIRDTFNLFNAGVRSHDILQSTLSIGMSVAGWGIYLASTNLKNSFIPIGPGNIKRQILVIKDLSPTCIISTSGYLQYLYSHLSKNDMNKIGKKIAIALGEPLSENFKNQFSNFLEIYRGFGMTEMGGHIAGECSFHNGLHVLENYFYCEIINPDTGELVPEGEYGELVITPLQQESMPLIRYRTRDITRFLSGDCPCGRTHRRIEPITHRIDDMMIINGVNVFPSQIEECIYKHLTTATNYLIHIKEKDGLKKLVIDIELPTEQLQNSDGMKKLEYELIQTLKSYITVTPRLNFLPIGTLPEIQGKAKRIVKDIE